MAPRRFSGYHPPALAKNRRLEPAFLRVASVIVPLDFSPNPNCWQFRY